MKKVLGIQRLHMVAVKCLNTDVTANADAYLFKRGLKYQAILAANPPQGEDGSPCS
jgi:hypothetical protein